MGLIEKLLSGDKKTIIILIIGGLVITLLFYGLVAFVVVKAIKSL